MDHDGVMKKIEMEVCSPAGRVFNLRHNCISSFWRFVNSPNPLESEWFSIGITVSPRFNGGSYGSWRCQMKQIEMMVCIPTGRAVKLLHSKRLSVWRLFNSPNPSDSVTRQYGGNR